MKYEPNKIKTDIASYRHYWRGPKKIGKTTLFRDLLKVVYGDYKYGLDIAPGLETGYKALDGLYAREAPTWEDFVNIVDDLVDHKEDNEFKLIALDTVDELVSIAEEKVLKIHFQRENEKAKSINASLGGYGAGQRKVQELINEQIKRLENSGYGLVFVGHAKIKDIKEKNMSEPYQYLTGTLDPRYDSIFTDKADIIATIGNARGTNNKKLTGTERNIYFRADGFVDAGSRFANMPESVSFSAENYFSAITQGIKSSFINNVLPDELEKMRKEELAEKERKAQEYIEKTKSENEEKFAGLETIDDYKNAIEKKLSELSDDTKKQKRAEFKEQKLPTKFKEVDDIEVLKKILKVFSE
jgi:hypothetical protein